MKNGKYIIKFSKQADKDKIKLKNSGLDKNAKVILFDEATSALDNESQEYIKKTIDDLVSTHTIIIVAHRLSTIMDADIIYLIENGKVLASGNHKELIKTSSLYKRLYNPEMNINENDLFKF